MHYKAVFFIGSLFFIITRPIPYILQWYSSIYYSMVLIYKIVQYYINFSTPNAVPKSFPKPIITVRQQT